MKVRNAGVLAVLVLCLVGLSACNTMRGFGKDLSKVGQKIENAAER